MRTPEEIKGILNVCGHGESCKKCPRTDKTDDCTEVVMLEALEYIRQLEAHIAELEAKTSEPDNDLPKGWVELHSFHDEGNPPICINATMVKCITDNGQLRSVLFSGERGNFCAVTETVPEILSKIKEAT